MFGAHLKRYFLSSPQKAQSTILSTLLTGTLTFRMKKQVKHTVRMSGQEGCHLNRGFSRLGHQTPASREPAHRPPAVCGGSGPARPQPCVPLHHTGNLPEGSHHTVVNVFQAPG